MSVIRVVGGSALVGRCQVQGSKNAALALYAAALVPDGPVRLTNLPEIIDVSVCAELAEALGYRVESDRGTHLISPRGKAAITALPDGLAKAIRTSVIVAAAILATRRAVSFSPPGGDAFCPRPIDLHVAAMRAAGAEVTTVGRRIDARLDGPPRGFNFSADTRWGPSLGATVTALLLAVVADGTSFITEPSPDPEVTAVVHFLRSAGADVCRRDDGALVVAGVPRLHGTAFAVPPDRHEAGTIAMATVLTSGRVTMEGVSGCDLSPGLTELLKACGGQMTGDGASVAVEAVGTPMPSDLEATPYPGFPTDLQPVAAVLLTQAGGVSRINDRIFPRRMSHVDGLCRLGARVAVTGHQVLITGPTRLAGVPLVAADIRCAAAFVLAGLVAAGETRIMGTAHLDRGYADLTGKLRALGADIRVGG